jgi:hypothetical protein
MPRRRATTNRRAAKEVTAREPEITLTDEMVDDSTTDVMTTCPGCGRKFFVASNLTRHMEADHGDHPRSA